MTMPLLDSHGNEPPTTVAEAMAAADVAFTCTSHAITHTRSRLAAAEAGTRFGILRSVTEDMMVEGGMSVDFEELRRRTEAVRDVLDAATEAHVTSDKGTDITFSLEGCSAFSLDGYYHENYGFATLPPGESPTHPAEGTANGEIVIDVSMDNLGQVDEPITLEVEDGFVTDVTGGDDADELRRIIDENDENAGNIAEFAIGTNPEAKLIGNLAEDKRRRGRSTSRSATTSRSEARLKATSTSTASSGRRPSDSTAKSSSTTAHSSSRSSTERTGAVRSEAATADIFATTDPDRSG